MGLESVSASKDVIEDRGPKQIVQLSFNLYTIFIAGPYSPFSSSAYQISSWLGFKLGSLKIWHFSVFPILFLCMAYTFPITFQTQNKSKTVKDSNSQFLGAISSEIFWSSCSMFCHIPVPAAIYLSLLPYTCPW